MRYAGFWRRALALAVDLLIWLPLIGIAFLVGDSRTGLIAGELVGTALAIAYPVFMHGRFGQTVGKMAARIQVRLVSGAQITWRAAWLRSAVDIVFALVMTTGEIYVFMQLPADGWSIFGPEFAAFIAEREPAWLRYAGYAFMAWVASELVVLLFNKKRRALHDFIAGTVVVHLTPAPVATTTAAPGADVPRP